MFMPKISVVIPTYNRAHIVGEAIDCVLSQTEQSFEIVIADDGSSDDTKNIIDAFGDGRIKYHYKENGGVSSARNMGISKATGDYIAFLDSDDLWQKKHLELMCKALEENSDFGAAYGIIATFFEDGRVKPNHSSEQCKSGWITEDLFKVGFVSAQATMFRSQVLDGFGFDESLQTAEDSDAFLRLSLKIKFLFVTDVYVNLRGSDTSLMVTAGINCNRILSLDRFYYRLGGKSKISCFTARVKLSRACRQVAKRCFRAKNRKAAISLLLKAIYYWPVDLRLYVDLAKSLVMRKKNDNMPDWKFPDKLGEPVFSQRIDV